MILQFENIDFENGSLFERIHLSVQELKAMVCQMSGALKRYDVGKQLKIRYDISYVSFVSMS